MQQFLSVNGKMVVSVVKPMPSCLQLVCNVNELDKFGNFVRRDIVHVSLFNAAQKAILKRNIKPGDVIIILNGKYHTYTNPQNVLYTNVVCNYANQVDVIANGNHDTLNQRNTEEDSHASN